MAKNTRTTSPNFTQAFRELETISKEFEQEPIDLEQSVEKFERGLFLARICRERLQEVENRVKIIEESFNQTKE